MARDHSGKTQSFEFEKGKVVKRRFGTTPGGRKYTSTLYLHPDALLPGGKTKKSTTVEAGKGERKTHYKSTDTKGKVVKESQKWGEAPTEVKKGPTKAIKRSR